MSGAFLDEKPLETSKRNRCTETFLLGTFHAAVDPF